MVYYYFNSDKVRVSSASISNFCLWRPVTFFPLLKLFNSLFVNNIPFNQTEYTLELKYTQKIYIII